jgi:hypothetical protein
LLGPAASDLSSITTAPSENLYWRLAVLRGIIPEKDLMLPQKGILQAIKKNVSKSSFSELGSLSTGSFAKAFLGISSAISEKKYLRLYQEFIVVCTPLIVFLDSKGEDFSQALKELESSLNKSTLDEFEFREYSYLYGRYIEFLRSLQFIVQSRIPLLKNPTELPVKIIRRSPHFVMNYIVYVGGNISMMNELCCRAILRFLEY